MNKINLSVLSSPERTAVLVVAILTTPYAIWLGLEEHYYLYNDYLGPLTDLRLLFLYVLIISLLVFIIIKTKSTIVALSAFVFVFLVKFFIPQFFDSFYTENFYDAWGHVRKGVFVAVTGHSDPRVDWYYELQSGFFWWTAIFMHMAMGSVHGLDAQQTYFVVKWFNLVAIIIYIPILAYLLRRLDLPTYSIIAVIALIFVITYDRMHYAAQTYAWAIYWFVLALALKYLKERELRVIIVMVTALVSLIFVHQGATAFSMLAVFSLVMILIAHRADRQKKVFLIKASAVFAVTLVAALWYISFSQTAWFEVVKRDINRAISKIPDAPNLIFAAIYRPEPNWMLIVMLKAVLMVSSVLLVWKFTLAKRKDSLYAFLFLSSFLAALLLGYLAVSFGGAGYVERVYVALTPLLALGLYLGATRTKSRLVFSLVILFTLLLSVTYFTGWNLQSVTFSERKSYVTLIEKTDNIFGIYVNKTVCIDILYSPVFPYRDRPGRCIYIESRRVNIEAVYYRLGDWQRILEARRQVEDRFNLVFSSPTVKLYWK